MDGCACCARCWPMLQGHAVPGGVGSSSVMGAAARLWSSGLPVAQEAAPFLPPLSPVPKVGLSQVLETLDDDPLHFREGFYACVVAIPERTILVIYSKEGMPALAWGARLLRFW